MFTVRSIKEQDTDPSSSLYKEEQTSPNTASKPNIDQSTLALNQLKQTDQFIDQMKRRLSLLKIQDEKNQKKADSNEKKFEHHVRIRKSAAW